MLNAKGVNILKFGSAKEMYDMILDDQDLYSPNKGLFLFHYNMDEAITYYCIGQNEAKELVQKSKDTGEGWSCHLGVGGSIIDPEDDGEDINSILEYLEGCYKEIWLTTEDYGKLLEDGISIEARDDIGSADVICIQNDKTQLKFEYIGEGWYGDYNKEEPFDDPLIRFTASVKADPDAAWEQMNDGSYCTSLPLSTDNSTLGIIALDMFFRFALVTDGYLRGVSVKRLGEKLSLADSSDEYISEIKNIRTDRVDNPTDVENLKKQLWNLRSELTADDCEDIFNTLTTADPVLGGKIWTEKDIAEKLEEEGYEDSRKNIDTVREHLEEINVLNDVTDEECQCFYNAIEDARDQLGLTFRMSVKVRFNRPIKVADSITPGGYEMVFNGKTIAFDFEDCQWGIDYRDPSGQTMWFEQKNPDYSAFPDLNYLVEEDLLHFEEIKEFYIDTECGCDTDLIPEEIKEFYVDTECDTDLIPEEVISITFSTDSMVESYDVNWRVM